MRRYLYLAIILLFACTFSSETKAKRIIEEGIDDESKAVRIEAARGLRSVDPARSADLLIEMLEDREPEVQAAALDALVPYTTTAPRLDPVFSRLCVNRNISVRVAAYRNVASSTDTGGKALLRQALTDESARVRQIGYSGLARFRDRDVLQNGFQDSDPLVRIAVAKALAHMDSDGMIEYIREELKKLSPDALGPGIVMLAQSGDTTARQLMKTLLTESTGELRVDVAEALLILNDRAGIGALEKAMQSKDPFVRIKAVEVLRRHDIPEMRVLLDAATKDDYVNVAVQAVQALAEHDRQNYRKRFLELMGSKNPLLRVAAAGAYLGS